MKVSFKVAKTGRRFFPKPKESNDRLENSNETNKNENNDKTQFTTMPMLQVNVTKTDAEGAKTDAEELEVSFIVNVFRDGFLIGKPSEAMLQHLPESLHPYDRKAESFFSAIECGQVPRDIPDDLPFKYVNGTLLCEVRDYRDCFSEAGSASSSCDVSPIRNKVRLRLSLENVIQDIPLISNKTWTYGDLIEVESRIVKALQPQLCLDPTPKLDRLCESPIGKKLNLDIRSQRISKRLKEKTEVIVTSNDNVQGKKVCTDRVSESRIGMQQRLPTQHTFMNIKSEVYTENMNPGVSSVHTITDTEDNPISPETGSSPAGNQQQLIVAPMVILQGSDFHRNNTMSSQQEFFGRGSQDPNIGLQKFPWQMYAEVKQEPGETTQFSASAQQRLRFPEEARVGTMNSEVYQIRNGLHMVEAEKVRMQQGLLPQHAFLRSNFTQPPWNNSVQLIDNNLKEDQLRKRKSAQNHCVSRGGSSQSLLMQRSSSPEKNGNVMVLGGSRGIGGQTISGPIGQISGMGQNPMIQGGNSNINNTISKQIHTDQLTSQALLASVRMTSRGIVIGGSQSTLGGIQGAGEMYPDSMLGNSLNRSMNPIQRPATGSMGPPQPMRGMNPFVNPQLQQKQEPQQVQQMQMQLLQYNHLNQQMLQQPDSASPLQAVVSLPQQFSQQFQQYQQQQAASPQLSSQGVGSYITNPPMEQLHGANNNI